MTPSHYGRYFSIPLRYTEDNKKTEKRGPTLALAFLQLVQALGVMESGTFLFLPAEVPGLGWPDACPEEIGLAEGVGAVGAVGDDGWTSYTD